MKDINRKFKERIQALLKKRYLTRLKKLQSNSIFIVVILPWLICALYYIFLATPRYESSAIVTLKQNESSSIPDTSLGLLSGIAPQASSNDYLLVNYINSSGMLDLLNHQLYLKKVYQNNTIDLITRLSKNANQQDFLDYYQDMVSAIYDPEASMITLSAQGYTPEQARKILQHIIQNSQNAIDSISHALAQQRMKFSESQMSIAREKALSAQNNLLKFQNQYGTVDPENSLIAFSGIINTMQAEIATTESELTAMRSYLNENTPEIKAAKQKILALQNQIDKEKSRLLHAEKSSENNENLKELNQLTSTYTWVKLNAEFAMSEYTAAMQSYEVAKMDTLKQQSYLVTVVNPTIPDEPAYPRVWYNLLTLMIILLAIYGIGRMIITIIMEHK